jgi:hypothetical protein
MRMNVCQCFKYGVRLYCMSIIKLAVYLGFTVNEVFFNGVHKSAFQYCCPGDGRTTRPTPQPCHWQHVTKMKNKCPLGIIKFGCLLILLCYKKGCPKSAVSTKW